MHDYNMELEKIKNTITSLDLLEKNGWEVTYGLSKINDESRYDDLISRTKFTKTFPGEIRYEIILNCAKIDMKKSLTSLPGILSGRDSDFTNFYRVIGKEFIGTKLISTGGEDVYSENPYLSALGLAVNQISKFEAGSKKIITGKDVKFYIKQLKNIK